MDAGLTVQDVRSGPVNASRESTLSETLQRRAEVYPQKSPTYAQTSHPQTDAESEPPRPPGDFVSAAYASDCARFIAESKNRARRRVEAGLAYPAIAL
jgi:hypothetical protein